MNKSPAKNRTGKVLYAITLFRKVEKLDRNADLARAQLNAVMCQLTHDETVEYVRATSPDVHPEGCRCDEINNLLAMCSPDKREEYLKKALVEVKSKIDFMRNITSSTSNFEEDFKECAEKQLNGYLKKSNNINSLLRENAFIDPASPQRPKGFKVVRRSKQWQW